MDILGEAHNDNFVDPNQVVPSIDFESVSQIPESHVWIEQNVSKIPHEKTEENHLGLNLPTIDLEDPNASELLLEALKIWGSFQIINHGVSQQLLDKAVNQSKRLFALPMEEKKKVLRTPEDITGYGTHLIAPFFSKEMWGDGFIIKGNSSLDHAKKLWPNDYQEFCDVMDEYQASMKGVSKKLMTLILKSLQIPESFLNWKSTDDSKNLVVSTALKINSYPICPNPSQAIGLGPHTDTFFFTIVYGNINGLQVLNDEFGWVSVDQVPGALIVNLGDVFHMISNARFPCTVHRVVVNNDEQRISFGYAYGPPMEFEISPFLGYPDCEGPRFKPLLFKEYVDIKGKNLHSALSFVKI